MRREEEEEEKERGAKMSKKLSANAMDDVDRLFQCFKCGISPPGELLSSLAPHKLIHLL